MPCETLFRRAAAASCSFFPVNRPGDRLRDYHSHFSKAAIIRQYVVAPDKVTVTHLGAGWLEDEDAGCHAELKLEAYHLPERYIVAFGGSSPHKNITRLISAFQLMARDFPHSLVLIGHVPPDVDLSALMQNADLSNVSWRWAMSHANILDRF